MDGNFRHSLSYIIALGLIFSGCANSPKVDNETEILESRADVVTITPTPFAGKPVVIRGENSAIEITENLRDSVEQQPLPSVWLEFEKENGEFSRVELNENFREKLNSTGRSLFRYQYVKNNSENPDETANAAYTQTVTFTNMRNEMEELEIDSPSGKRKLSQTEAGQILHKQAGLINDRYYELDDYFKPKSDFRRFKESVNEKLGYAIF